MGLICSAPYPHPRRAVGPICSNLNRLRDFPAPALRVLMRHALASETRSLSFAIGPVRLTEMSASKQCCSFAWDRRSYHDRCHHNGRLIPLSMHLDGDKKALAAYHAGDRTSDLVAPYFRRAGMWV